MTHQEAVGYLLLLPGPLSHPAEGPQPQSKVLLRGFAPSLHQGRGLAMLRRLKSKFGEGGSLSTSPGPRRRWWEKGRVRLGGPG